MGFEDSIFKKKIFFKDFLNGNELENYIKRELKK